MWVSSFPLKNLDWIEFYAGKARATLAMRGAGLRGAALDYMYFDPSVGGSNYFDVLTDSGFAQPDECPAYKRMVWWAELVWLLSAIYNSVLRVQVRLCIATILKAKLGECVILLGMKCSSFTVVNLGTSKRAPCNPEGDWGQPSVAAANVMGARSPESECKHGNTGSPWRDTHSPEYLINCDELTVLQSKDVRVRHWKFLAVHTVGTKVGATSLGMNKVGFISLSFLFLSGLYYSSCWLLRQTMYGFLSNHTGQCFAGTHAFGSSRRP